MHVDEKTGNSKTSEEIPGVCEGEGEVGSTCLTRLITAETKHIKALLISEL